MTKNNFLIYGSYGYTGTLIAQLACQQGLRPVLGGRNKEKLAAQAAQLNLEYRVFDLDNLQASTDALNEFVCVIHCAGPFIHTYKKMIQACIAAQTHYLDITGEVGVIEKLSQMNSQAQAANIMVLPGAGFDVVPSDCLAQHLKSRLPDACELTLAINSLQNEKSTGLGISRGTAKTISEGLSYGTLIREQGVLKTVPLAWKKRSFDFGNHKETTCALVSWGDLASAWWSTHIPHIETYMATPKNLILAFKLLNPIKSIFKWKLITQFIEKKINAMPEGPTADMRKNATSQVYGEVKNPDGKIMASLLKTPDGYDVTAMTALIIVQKILAGEFSVGFQTPSTAYGKDLILEVTGVTREDL